MDLLLMLRGLAALSVLIWHSVGFHGGFPLINVPGRTAVLLFFGISGYVIAYGFIHKRYTYAWDDIRDFYVNRLLRIYPIFLVLSCIGWLTGLLLTGNSSVKLADVPAQLFAYQFDHSYVLNSIFWTLGIEIQFYLLAPLLMLFFSVFQGRQRTLFLTFIYLLMCLWISYATRNLGWSHDRHNLVSNLPHFFVGMIGCQIVASLRPNAWRFRSSIAAACILLILTNWVYHMKPGIYWSFLGIFLIDALILCMVVAHASVTGGDEKTRPKFIVVLTFLGTLSYGLYVWHGYLMQYIPYMYDHTFALVFTSLFFAYVSYRLVEQPILRLKRNHPIR